MLADIKGTGVALVTPIKSDGSIDYSSLNNLIKHVSDHGCEYLVVLGTTGETATLSKDEKKEVLEFVKANNYKNLPVVYGIGGNNTSELIDELKSTDLSGVKAILSVSPYYNKPSQEGIFRHYSVLADAAPVPVILYNVPGRTGMNMQAKTVTRLADHKNIIGVKEASGDLIQCMEIQAGTPDDFVLIAGDDLLAVPMISIGGVGSIAVLANLYPRKFSDMIRYSLKGDFKAATELLLQFTGLNPLLYTEGNPVGAKAALSILGLIENNVRLPLAPASDGLFAAIKAEVAKIKA
ncbi:MAG TPA: 4-hydroxy-tetrahydrodipicolinate synthase [Cytophagales bacterium]|nr:4-hydroxy-tetrahydrodipicolinate synthase [Cytophagales bacterium]